MGFPDRKDIDRYLKNVREGKIKATKIVSDSASPIDKMKFNICQKIIRFKLDHKSSNLELSKTIGVGPAVISRIIHCELDRFKVDSLLGYYFILVLSSKDAKLIREFQKEVSEFLKKAA